MAEIKQPDKTASELERAPESIHERDKTNLADVDLMLVDTERAPEARGTNINDVPRSYWFSVRFIGSFVAIILAKDAGSGGFSLAAPLLSTINRDIGPSLNINWVSLGWVLSQGVSALIVGRLTDVFGRRYIFIGGSVIGLIGSIFASQVQTVEQLIGASVMLGVAGGIQINYFWAISEIVPMKFRYLANMVIYATSVTTWMGPKIAYDFQTQTPVHWRGGYYLLIALNALSVAAWYFFYHPPTFRMLHRRKASKELLVTFDWVGLGLFIAGSVIFLAALNWGGSRYPWNSVEVISTLVAGAVGMALFILWEIYLPRRSKDIIPFVTMHYFKNFPFIAITVMTGIGASAYYGFSAIWPALVNRVYPGMSQSKTGNMLCLVVLSFVFSQMLGNVVAHYMGPKPTIIVAMMIAGPLLACVAIDPMNMTLTSTMIFLGCFSLGIMEGCALTTSTFPLRTQEEIGTAGGLSNTIRLFISNVAVAAYTTTRENRLAKTIPANVSPAAINAGLPSTSVPQLLKALAGGLALNSTTVPGINTEIETVSRFAFRVANAQAYRTVFLVSLTFTGPGMILCWFIAQNDKKKDDFIAGHIHNPKEKKALEQQQG